MIRRIFIFCLLLPVSTLALYAEVPLADPAQEAQAQALFKEIRCVVCEGQTIADSNAELAHDMRTIIRNDIRNGIAANDIKQFLVHRYGEEVLMATPIAPATYLLWLTPLLFLLVGAIAAFRLRKK